ncbi:MAG: hypothetical protein ACTSQO_09135 [Candidatus Helarchaeota archaeon]
MKTIQFLLINSEILKINKEPFTILIDDTGNIIHTIAKADLELFKMTNGQFPIKGIKSMLQVIYNPKTGEFYEDVGIDVRDNNKKYLNVRSDPLLILPDQTVAIFTPDIGC